jgi:hypothetical protein
MTVEGDRVVKRAIDFHLRRERGRDEIVIAADGPLAAVRVRLGPYPAGTQEVRVNRQRPG